MLRRRVADDHSCLFTAIAYGGAPPGEAESAEALRKHCAAIVEKANFFSAEMPNELALGMTVPEYQEWIVNEFHW